MPKIKNTFHLGIMDKDTDSSLVANGATRHVENLRFHNNDGNDNIGVNIKGSSIVSDATSGSSDLKCVGAYFDSDKDVIYYFLASTNGVISKVVEYNILNNNTTIVSEDNQSILNFNKNGFITGVNEINGLLLFSEWGNNPRRLNIERAKGYGLNGFTEDDIAVAIKPPQQKLVITLEDTIGSGEENYIEEKIIYFSYRWRHLDGEYSSLAPFSNPAFLPKDFKYNYNEQSNESMVNRFNQVSIDFNTGSKRVSEIQLVFKESESDDVWIIDDFDKALLSYGDNETKTYKFNNNKTFRALSKHVNNVNFNNVPRTSKAQTMIDGRVLYGYYKEFYNIKDVNQDKINIDFSLLLDAQPNGSTILDTYIPSYVPKETVKSNRDYEIGIIYEDNFGRQSTVLVSKTNTLKIPNLNSVTANSIHVILKNKPPYWATKYRFFIKQSKKGYNQILPNLFYEDGVFKWIRLEGADKDKVSEGDYLIAKSDPTQVSQTLIKVKVLEIAQQEKNFLQPLSENTTIEERAGLYFKIEPSSGFRMDADDFESFYLSTYDKTGNFWTSGGIDSVYNLTPYISRAHFYGDTLDDLTSGGLYTGSTTSLVSHKSRYYIKIDSLKVSAIGSVELTGGASGSVDGITVDGSQIMNGAVPFNTDLPTTAQDVVDNINGFTSVPNYTAILNGNTIEIISATGGTVDNGFVVLSSTTTITSTDVNLSGGLDVNTFKWSEDEGNNYVEEKVPITAGVPHVLSNGVEITFGANTGHSLLDEWYVNARSSWNVSSGSRAYGFLRTVGAVNEEIGSIEREKIYNGASLFFTYDEYKRGDNYFKIDQSANGDYDNIQEWFEKENIYDDVIAPQCSLPRENINFVKGIVRRGAFVLDGQVFYLEGDEARAIEQRDDVGITTMVIMSEEHSTEIKDVKVRCISDTYQTPLLLPILFETEPKDQPYQTFFEIGKTYDIIGGFHISDNPNIASDVDQSIGVDLRVKLDFFNAYSYGNAVESYKIKDEFNSKGLDVGVRVSAVSKEEYKEVDRIADVTWSDVYEDETSFNGLNTFNLSLINFVKLDKENSSIQKLHNSNRNLMVLQEDAVGLMLYNKTVIYSADGNGTIGVSTNILEKESYRPYAGIHGISKNPEGFISVANRNYFPDRMRGDIIRLSTDGVTEINQYFMELFTSKEMNSNKGLSMVGGYDPKHKEYLLHLPNSAKTLGFKDSKRGFPMFYTFEPDFMVHGNNELYAWKNGVMHKMNSSETRNNFFGVQYSSKINFFMNSGKEFSVEKIAKAIGLESTHAWLVNISTKLTGREIPKESFEKIEDYWYSEVMGNTNDSKLSNSTYGLGSYEIIGGEIITSKKATSLSIGDHIVSSSLLFAPNKVTDILDDRIVLETNITTVLSFLMYQKDANIDGEDIRGDVFDIEMINDDTEKAELRAVNLEVIKSENS